ncbi:MAG TPA: class I SAM-dependent methyltransferase [Flavobacteriales bacterium]|nr:class I SAM-dependent methyltransferase [Flavobacteriales bacterium]HMR27249.1 class I SAM-dependent methyltransferase [Flavobacteriales bacterium]
MRHPADALQAFGPVEHGVALLERPGRFGDLYDRARGLEGRILDDAEVARLPHRSGGPHRWEWRVRARNAQRLLVHLARPAPRSTVLDVGCGNGWMSALLARAGHTVLGIDRNLPELRQAARVFPDGPRFALADLFNPALDDLRFNVVLFAASFHYFADARSTLQRARMLAPDGEVHVMDSTLYPDQKAAGEARARTAAYYAHIGVPELAAHYHAHTLEDVRTAGPHLILRRPRGWNAPVDRLYGLRDPFHHVVLRS